MKFLYEMSFIDASHGRRMSSTWMPYLALNIAVLLISQEVFSHPIDPQLYIEVYPDPNDPEILKGRTPLFFALILSLGGPVFDASGSLAGVKIALDRINNDSSILPGHTLHYTLTDSQCNRTIGIGALFAQILNEPTKLAVIGSGCSPTTVPTAEISHLFNITQISCVSSSQELSSRIRFPKYFQLLSPIERIAFGFFGIIKEFGWKRISIFTQDDTLFRIPMDLLKNLLKKDGIEHTERIFRTITELENPFDGDTRIYLFFMYASLARPLFCKAYQQRIFFPKYMIMTPGWYRRFWWSFEQTGSCTPQEIEMVLASTLAPIDDILLDDTSDLNQNTTPGITVGEFLMEERKIINQSPLNITFHPYSQYCHDATWTLAYALDNTINDLDDSLMDEELAQAYDASLSPFNLQNISYSNDGLLRRIFSHIKTTSFDGITGFVSFSPNGIRDIDFFLVSVLQYRNLTDDSGTYYLERQLVGLISSEGEKFMYLEGESSSTLFSGYTLYDGVPIERIVTLHPAITCITIAFAIAGIVLAIVCLLFNFINRKTRILQQASAKLNYLIAIGAILLYCHVILVVIPTFTAELRTGVCILMPWFTAIGLSLCYGTILVRMARIYYIFRATSTKRKRLHVRVILLGVAVLVAIDIVILVSHLIFDGVRGELSATRIPSEENLSSIEGELEIVVHNFIYVCSTMGRNIFIGLLFMYKIILQIIAIILAFSIRNVKIKGLDDLKYVIAAIYVTSIVLVVLIVATYPLDRVVNGIALLQATGFLIGTTAILLLVFLPLMVTLYKDPLGEQIFTSMTKSTVASLTGNEGRLNDIECQNLRKKVIELELMLTKKNAKMNDSGLKTSSNEAVAIARTRARVSWTIKKPRYHNQKQSTSSTEDTLRHKKSCAHQQTTKTENRMPAKYSTTSSQMTRSVSL